MEIGIIGLGSITLNLAQRAAQSGFTVFVNNPLGNNLLREAIRLEKNIKLAEAGAVVAAAEIIIIFLPYENLEKVLRSLPDMRGKIIVNTNNPVFNPRHAGAEIAEGPAASMTASILPYADIIKFYNFLHPSRAIAGIQDTKQAEIFFSGKSQNAKNKIKSFLEKLDLLGIDLENQPGINSNN
ncbi:NAD(P)-binding domain-containing protein [Flavobacterium sp. F52]|uniref:NAD(P)-binding domain-containing protein n=1 Tax=Flavobacterium sp. F52 TaxID=1202532 RepID=UPI000272D867|nr:NAD(P)-binding domain-containing protein [Flavobacterium sp. F52]EJG03174.1 NADP oxidoreductase, coenzyme F420-dependent protein [Flavobacterium sp. F52]